MQTMIGAFSERDNAQHVVDILRARGFDTKDISFEMEGESEMDRIGHKTDEDIVQDATAGAIKGAVVGAIVGLVSVLLIPAMQSFFAIWPSANLFGLTGLAAAIISSTITGAIAGALIGILLQLSFDRSYSTADSLQKAKSTLIAVPAQKGEEQFVEHLFHDFGATDVKVIQQPIVNYSANTAHQEEVVGYHPEQAPFGFRMAMAGAKGGTAAREKKEHTPPKEHKREVHAKKGETIHIVIETKEE